MSESHTESHVNGQERRSAPAWEWTTDEEVRVEELRAEIAKLESEMDRVRLAVTDARAREHEARQALLRLAHARPWKRREVVSELAGRGLL